MQFASRTELGEWLRQYQFQCWLDAGGCRECRGSGEVVGELEFGRVSCPACDGTYAPYKEDLSRLMGPYVTPQLWRYAYNFRGNGGPIVTLTPSTVEFFCLKTERRIRARTNFLIDPDRDEASLRAVVERNLVGGWAKALDRVLTLLQEGRTDLARIVLSALIREIPTSASVRVAREYLEEYDGLQTFLEEARVREDYLSVQEPPMCRYVTTRYGVGIQGRGLQLGSCLVATRTGSMWVDVTRIVGGVGYTYRNGYFPKLRSYVQ